MLFGLIFVFNFNYKTSCFIFILFLVFKSLCWKQWKEKMTKETSNVFTLSLYKLLKIRKKSDVFLIKGENRNWKKKCFQAK